MLRRLHLLAVLTTFSIGCSNEPYKTASVSGRVTLNDKPAAMVDVMFQPVATEGNSNPGPGSYGLTDADGRYSLKLVGKETKGAVVGKHKVRIYAHVDPGDPSDDRPRKVKPLTPVPAKYHEATAILEFDVPAKGSDTADFAMKDK